MGRGKPKKPENPFVQHVTGPILQIVDKNKKRKDIDYIRYMHKNPEKINDDLIIQFIKRFIANEDFLKELTPELVSSIISHIEINHVKNIIQRKRFKEKVTEPIKSLFDQLFERKRPKLTFKIEELLGPVSFLDEHLTNYEKDVDKHIRKVVEKFSEFEEKLLSMFEKQDIIEISTHIKENYSHILVEQELREFDLSKERAKTEKRTKVFELFVETVLRPIERANFNKSILNKTQMEKFETFLSNVTSFKRDATRDPASKMKSIIEKFHEVTPILLEIAAQPAFVNEISEKIKLIPDIEQIQSTTHLLSLADLPSLEKNKA